MSRLPSLDSVSQPKRAASAKTPSRKSNPLRKSNEEPLSGHHEERPLTARSAKEHSKQKRPSTPKSLGVIELAPATDFQKRKGSPPTSRWDDLALLEKIRRLGNCSFSYTAMKINMLVIGRDNVACTMVFKYLQGLGYEVEWADSPEEGIELIKERPEYFELIFVPVLFADSTGMEFIEQIRIFKKNYDSLPVVMITAGGGPETVIKSLQAGAMDCLRNPITVEVLKTRVRTYVESIWMRKQLQEIVLSEELKDMEREQKYQDEQDSFAALEEQIQQNKKMQAELQELRDQSATRTEMVKLQSRIEELESQNKTLTMDLSEVRIARDSLMFKVGMLESEKEKGVHLHQVLQLKDKEIENMKKELKQAWETPLSSLIRKMKDYATTPDDVPLTGEDLKEAIGSIVSSLQNADLYSPDFDGYQMDDMTKNWMNDQFAPRPWLRKKTSSVIFDKEAMIGKTPRSIKNSTSHDTVNAGKQQISPTSEVAPSTDLKLETIIAAPTRRAYLAKVQSLDFSVWELNHQEMFHVLTVMMDDIGLISAFKIPLEKLFVFLRFVEQNYEPGNPYHNFFHAVDVFQTVYYVLKHTNAQESLTTIDLLAVLLGALCHDTNHPGLTNGYQVAAQTRLARIYNDRSVLENHHCFRTFEILDDEDCNILCNLSTAQFREFRSIIINAILGTDMASHFEITTKFSTHVETKGSFSKDQQADRQLLVTVILHSADISNVCKPWIISKRWSDKVFEEFLGQGDLERDQGMSISPYMDRHNTNQAKMTLGFIDFMCMPFFTALRKYSEELSPLLDNMAANRLKWTEIVDNPPPVIEVTPVVSRAKGWTRVKKVLIPPAEAPEATPSSPPTQANNSKRNTVLPKVLDLNFKFPGGGGGGKAAAAPAQKISIAPSSAAQDRIRRNSVV